MLNALTIDIEDYFQVHAFSHISRYEDWDKYECRVEKNTRHILDILNGSRRTSNAEQRTQVHATFFCLGWIAERYPQLINEIHRQGHEIACHGYAHRLIYRQSRGEFREDIRKAKAVLEDITGMEVIGYRAPSYSITKRSLWALEILAEEGFKYDSSIFPIKHDFYGFPDAPRFPFMVLLKDDGIPEFKPLSEPVNLDLCFPPSEKFTPNSELPPGRRPLRAGSRTSNCILEFPLSTVPLGRINLPLSGGGYFRIFPYLIFKKGLKRINETEGRPFIFYLHPWELDFEQPRIRGAGLRSKIRHYINLDKTEKRFDKLLNEFEFVTIKDLWNPVPVHIENLKRTEASLVH